MHSRLLRTMCVLGCVLPCAGAMHAQGVVPSADEKSFAETLAALPLEQALRQIREAPQSQMTPGAAIALRDIGNTYIDTKPPLSLPLYVEAQAIAVRSGDDAVRAPIDYNVGTANRLAGNLDAAKAALDESLELYAKLHPKLPDVAKVHSARSVVRMYLGDTEGAIADGETAYKENQQAGDEVGMARALNSLGNTEMVLGRFGQARQRFEEGLVLARKHNQRQGEAYLLNNIADSYLQEDNAELALPYALQAIKIKEEIGNREDLYSSLVNLARVYDSKDNNKDSNGRNKEALETIARAYAVAKEVNKPDAMARSLAEWGSIEEHNGHYDAALKLLQEGIAFTREVSDHLHENEMLVQIAETEFDLGRYDDAARDGQRVLEFARRASLPKMIEAAALVIARAQMKAGNYDGAHTSLQTAITAVEQMRDDTAGGMLAASEFFSHHAEDYQAMVEVDIKQQRWQEAFLTSEQEKGRALLDLLSQGRVSFGSALTPDERKEEAALRRKLTQIGGQRTSAALAAKPDARRIAELDTQLQATRAAMGSFRERMFAAHPQLERRQGRASLISMEQAAELMPSASTAVVEFELTPHATYLFTLTRGTAGPELHTYVIDITSPALTARIRKFATALQTRDPGFAAASHSLYQLLLAPAARDLAGKNSLVIVPSGDLWRLPFQALQRNDGKFLVETASVSYAPSLSVLRAYGKTSHRLSSLVAFGDPAEDLPEAAQEVQAVSRIYGKSHASSFLRKEASLENFRTAALTQDDHEVLLATHGVYDDRTPMSSYLLLASGETAARTVPLEASQIADMQLKSPLVVLSACETAKGKYQAGEGLIGLGWSFLAAGSQSAVASLWRVDSASTTELMIAFHRALRQGASPAVALQQAERRLAHDPKYHHPFYWAGFVVLGNN